MVRVQCPHCQRRYRTEIEAFGRTAVCTRCSRTFKIGESRPPFQWKHTDLAEDSWIGVPEPEEKREMKHCLICDAPLRPEMIRCPECGANQVTGVVHKQRRIEPASASRWESFPLRPVLILLAIALIGGGVFWGIRLLSHKTAEMGEELADSTLAASVAGQLRGGAEPGDLAAKFAGRVTDANLRRFMSGLAAENPEARQAAVLLIGAGRVTHLEPLVAAARGADGRLRGSAREALAAMGPRRVVQLSCHEDEAVRRSAADALSVLFDLSRQDPRAARLDQPMRVEEKITLLNQLCRPWPLLEGPFVARIAEQVSPMTLVVEQVGKGFYLRIGLVEFTSSLEARRFEIPIHRWCSATGTAVDERSVRELLAGRVLLEAPTGAEWTGWIELTPRRRISGPLPGFLPLPGAQAGQTIRTEIRLVRPLR